VCCNFSIVSGLPGFVKPKPHPALKPSLGGSWREPAAGARNRYLAESLRDREHFLGGAVSNIMEDVEDLV
jgi:hypothetical protein